MTSNADPLKNSDPWFVLATAIGLLLACLGIWLGGSAPLTVWVTIGTLTVVYWAAYFFGNPTLDSWFALPLKMLWGIGDLIANVLTIIK